MSRFVKTLIGAGVALAVLSIAVIVLINLPEKQEPVAETPPPETETYPLILETLANVKNVKFTSEDGSSVTIKVVGDSYEIDRPKDTLPQSVTTMDSAVSSAISQPTVDIIAVKPTAQQLSEFGLTKPSFSWQVNRADGTSIAFRVGIQDPTKTIYYVQQNGKDSVYGISTASVLSMNLKEPWFYDTTFAPYYEGTVTDENGDEIQQTLVNNLSRFSLIKPDGTEVEFRALTKEEMESAPVATGSFLLEKPYAVEANNYSIENSIIKPMMSIDPHDVADDKCEDPAIYGLDIPYKVTAEDSFGWKRTLLVGSFDNEKNGRYVMFEGTHTVLLDTGGDYSFLDTDPVLLRSTLIWLHPILDAVGVDMDLNGMARKLTFEVTNDHAEGNLDGVSISENNLKNLYIRILALDIDGNTDLQPDGREMYKFTIHMRDGTRPNMTLKSINARQYRIYMDGVETPFYLTAASLERVLGGLKTIDEKGEIERY